MFFSLYTGTLDRIVTDNTDLSLMLHPFVRFIAACLIILCFFAIILLYIVLLWGIWRKSRKTAPTANARGTQSDKVETKLTMAVLLTAMTLLLFYIGPIIGGLIATIFVSKTNRVYAESISFVFGLCVQLNGVINFAIYWRRFKNFREAFCR